MKPKTALLSAVLIAVAGMSVWATEPTTVPISSPATTTATADGAGELMQPKSGMIGYGAESYRIVDDRDEVVSVLRSGLTVIAKRVASPVVAVRGVVNTGGVYEGKWLGGGLSHLLEHLSCAGSNERRTEEQDRNLLQLIGNNSNAYTTEDRTAFFVNTTGPHAEEAVDLVTGWLTGAKIDPDEYRREYQVVQRELERGKGNPDFTFYEMAAANRYHVNPARVPVIGYQEVIQGLSRNDVYSYYKLAYEPHNMVFSVVGDRDPEELLKLVQKYVSDFKPSRVFEHDVPPEPPVLAARTVVATFPKLGQARLQLAFESVKLTGDDMYALDVLAAVLGNGDASMLVEELRDKRQLVTGVSANDDTPGYVEGTFGIDMQLDPDKVRAATDAALDVLESVKTRPVDAARIARAKTLIRTGQVRGMMTAEQIAAQLADDFIDTGDVHFRDKYAERVDHVTPEQLRAVARKYFHRTRLITTAMLPAEFVGAKGLPAAEDVLRGAAPTTKPVAAPAVASAVRRVELDNGTTLLVKRVATAPMVSIDMYALGGLSAEDATTNGIGNLAMQVLPRGTTTRSAEQVAAAFDDLGGSVDAGCGTNSWYWTADCLAADFDKAFAAYADVVNHPAFAAGETAAMKDRVVAGIAGEDAEWDRQAMRFFDGVYFGPSGSPYRFLPVGTAENVAKFTPDDLRKWYATKVLPARRVIAVYGDVDPDHVVALVQEKLGGGTNVAAAVKPQPPKAAGPTTDPTADPTTGPAKPGVDVTVVKVNKTDQPLAGVVIGFRSDAVLGEPSNYVLDVGQTMAGGWSYPTGYLFDTLRGKGLVYEVYADNRPGRSAATPGTFMVAAGCDPSKVNEVVDDVLLNVARLQGTPADVQPDWFGRSKQLIVTADAMDHETAAAQASTAALDELYGLGYGYHAKFAAAIDAVTLDQVRQTAAARLRACVVTVSTPNPESVNVPTGLRTYPAFPKVELAPRPVQHQSDLKQ